MANDEKRPLRREPPKPGAPKTPDVDDYAKRAQRLSEMKPVDHASVSPPKKADDVHRPLIASGAPVIVRSEDPSAMHEQPVGEPAQSNVDPMQSLADFSPEFAKILQRLNNAESELARLKGGPQSQSLVWSPQTEKPAWVPLKYLKHYRNDVNPKKIMFRGRYNPERDRFEGEKETQGQSLQFTNGHFYATEPWQVELLDWSMNHDQFNSHTNDVIGGDRSTYVDDDSADAIACPECLASGDPKYFASATKLAAHRKATHRIGAGV